MNLIQLYFCIFLSSAVLLLKHCNYLNILSIPAFCVSVKALWTNLGKLFLLCLYQRPTWNHWTIRPLFLRKGDSPTQRIQLAAGMIVYRSFVLCVLVII